MMDLWKRLVLSNGLDFLSRDRCLQDFVNIRFGGILITCNPMKKKSDCKYECEFGGVGKIDGVHGNIWSCMLGSNDWRRKQATCYGVYVCEGMCMFSRMDKL